ncbi:MAG: Rrf2 family transcriptional regulator [Phaeodactylibacter sp.]|nr:Rrf2 family transcriptional regulator [Phaeodactylibacter sp.]
MLSKRAKYAIKSLLFLYEKRGEAPVSARRISEEENIPYKFLENILRELKQNKVLKSERGAEGGYSFAQAPESITVASIVRMVDGPIALIPCVSENFYERCVECRDEESCQIRKLFAQIRSEMLPYLEQSIASLANL